MPFRPRKKEEPQEERGLVSSPWERTATGKILRATGTSARLGVKAAYLPLLRRFRPDVARTLEERGGDIYSADILRELVPTLQNEDWLAKGATAVGGMIGDLPFDPLTYLRFGGLTRPGIQALAQQPKKFLMTSRAAQAAAGQRALVSVGIPFTKRQATLFSGEGYYAATDFLRSGHAAEQTARTFGFASPHSATLRVAKFWDRLSSNVLQRFGSSVGVNPWLHQRMKQFMARSIGDPALRTQRTLADMDELIGEFADDIADYYKIPRPQRTVAEMIAKAGPLGTTNWMSTLEPAVRQRLLIREQLNRALLDAITDSPWLVELRQSPLLKVGGRFQALSSKDRAVRAFMREFPLPAQLGGPGSPWDPEVIRRFRELKIKMLRTNHQIFIDELKNTGHATRLAHDAGYMANILHPDVKRLLLEAHPTRQASRLGGRMARIQTESPHWIRRGMRWVNPQKLQEGIDNGTIPKFVKVQVGKRWKTVNVHNQLQKVAGDRPGKVQLAILNQLWKNHVWNEGMRKSIASGTKLGAQTFKARPSMDPFNIGRLTPSMTYRQANEYVFQRGIPGVASPGEIKQMFVEDPLEILTVRGARADRVLLSHEFFNEIKRTPELVVPRSAQLSPATANFRDAGNIYPQLRGYRIHPDAYEWFKRMNDVETHLPRWVESSIRTWDHAQRWWKAWVLGIFPPYVLRNAMSDNWQYNLGSSNVFDASRNLRESYKAWNAMAQGKRYTIKTANGQTVDAHDLYREVLRNNGWGAQQIPLDDPVSARQAIRTLRQFHFTDPERQLTNAYRRSGSASRWNGLVPPPEIAEAMKAGLNMGADSWYVNLGFRIQGVISDQFRLAHIIQKLREGHSVESAVASMKKYFFDYANMTPVERSYLRRAFPFYAWSRNNFPFVLESIFTHPDRITRFHSFLQGWTGSKNPEEESLMNDWMRRNFPLRIRRNSKTGEYEYFVLKNWLPLVDIQDIANIWGWARQSLTPFARVPLELIYNTNYFTGRKIDHLSEKVWQITGGERTSKFRPITSVVGPIPNKVAHVLSSFRLTNVLHQVLDNPQELDLTSRLVQLTAGRVYPLDVPRSVHELSKDLLELEQSYKRALRSAVFRGESPEELERLGRIYIERYEKLVGRREELAR